MTGTTTDRELLEAAWRTYDDEFADHVGEIVTPYEYVDTDEQAEWAARIFMFGFGLGAVAGGNAAAPEAVDRETDPERIDDIVGTVVDIHSSEEFAVSNARVLEDFLEERTD